MAREVPTVEGVVNLDKGVDEVVVTGVEGRAVEGEDSGDVVL